MKQHRKTLVFLSAVFVLLFFVGNVCPLEHIVGIPCPGCNMFTALYWLLLKGNSAMANYYHPAIWALLIYGVVLFVLYCFKKEKMSQTKLFKISTSLFLLVFLGVYIYRMCTVFPQYPMNFNENALLSKVFHLF